MTEETKRQYYYPYEYCRVCGGELSGSQKAIGVCPTCIQTDKTKVRRIKKPKYRGENA